MLICPFITLCAPTHSITITPTAAIALLILLCKLFKFATLKTSFKSFTNLLSVLKFTSSSILNAFTTSIPFSDSTKYDVKIALSSISCLFASLNALLNPNTTAAYSKTITRAIKNSVEFCRYKIIAPTTAIMLSIISVSVAPDTASLIFDASINLEIISPIFLLPKKLIGSSITCS